MKDSATRRGYDAAWQRLRLVVLERDGRLCRWCAGPADTVDHVHALADGGARLDPANLVACCRSCNSRRGQLVSARRGRGLAPGSGASRDPGFLGCGSTLDPAAVRNISPGGARGRSSVTMDW